MKLELQSSKPVRVRKRLLMNPVRERSLKLIRATLSDELKSKYGKNSIRVRIGDSVKLVRGEYSGVEGKIQHLFPKEGRLTLEGVTREKIKGGTAEVRIYASNVVVTGLNLDDKFRRTKLEGTT
ncbi:MAG: 50S ribosomal protein L24 [Nitrososphaerota archaeon]|nr:50S ribosomal protein L24 [Nitrososphaerota archaeon]